MTATAVEAFTFEQLSGGAIEVSAESSAAVRAAGLVAQAQAEAEAIRAEARELGFAEGHADGLAAAAAELEPKQALLASAAAEVHAALAELAAQAEREAVDLALALTDKILATALEVRPELVLDVVVGSLRGIVERDLVLEVHPDDIPLLEGGVDGIEVYAERRVPRGGCVVRTPEGEIDARIGEQLARAAEVLRAAL